jgi:hypothetical protein
METKTIWCDSPEAMEAKILAAGIALSNVLFIRWWTAEEVEANAQIEGGDVA